jgi:hypothetical protein
VLLSGGCTVVVGLASGGEFVTSGGITAVFAVVKDVELFDGVVGASLVADGEQAETSQSKVVTTASPHPTIKFLYLDIFRLPTTS